MTDRVLSSTLISEVYNESKRVTMRNVSLLVAHQIIVSMFGLQHMCHLLKVPTEGGLLRPLGISDRNDPLRDVGEVEFTAVLHGVNKAKTPVTIDRTSHMKLQETKYRTETFKIGIIYL